MRNRVTKREYIKDVYSSTDFRVSQIPINPGLSDVFPWLSTIAKSWEKYRFHRLRFEYRTLLTQYSANAAGRVMYLGDYDPLDGPPPDKRHFLDSQPVRETTPAKNMTLELPARVLNDDIDWRYVRKSQVPPTADPRFYDSGQLFIGTDDSPVNAKAGELWVDYDVEFEVPVTDQSELLTPHNVLAGYGKFSPWEPSTIGWQRKELSMAAMSLLATDGFVYELEALDAKVVDGDKLGLRPGWYECHLSGQVFGIDFDSTEAIEAVTAGLLVYNEVGSVLHIVPGDSTRHYAFNQKQVTAAYQTSQAAFSLCFPFLIQPSEAFPDGFARIKPYIQTIHNSHTGHMDMTYDLMLRGL